MPSGSEFGIDMQINQVGPNFRGVAGVPLGLHFLTFGTGQGLRQGFFVHISRPYEVLVKSWDPTEEELIEQGTGLREGSMHNLLQALQRGELNKQLGAYPEREQGRLWRDLSEYITEDVLALCGLKVETRILPGAWEEEKIHARGEEEKREGGELVPFFPGLGHAATFTDVRGAKRPKNALDMTPAEVTRYHLDRSQLLEEVLRDVYSKIGSSSSSASLLPSSFSSSSSSSSSPSFPSSSAWKALLGEYQLAFLLFLNLYSMAGLKHWKETTALLCHASLSPSLPQYFPLYHAFLHVFSAQSSAMPSDFFFNDEEGEMVKGKESFLQPCLRQLLRNVREGGREGEREGSGLLEEVELFARKMEARFLGFNLKARREGARKDEVEEEEEEEDGPLVVPWEEVERAMLRTTMTEDWEEEEREEIGKNRVLETIQEQEGVED
ncbi:protein aar2 homolog [Nannochloropsis oceanica]